MVRERYFSAESCAFYRQGLLVLSLDPRVGNPVGRKKIDIDARGVTFRNYDPAFAATVEDLEGSQWNGQVLVLRHGTRSVDSVLVESHECRAMTDSALETFNWVKTVNDAQ